MLSVRAFTQEILTHALTPAGPIPTAFDPDGVYPYERYVQTSQRPELRRYRMVALENSRLRALVCPDLGGKVWSLLHKASGKECLFVPGVVRPVRILPRQYFIGGGIEVSFPISHSPQQNDPLPFKMGRRAGRACVWVGSRELHSGMHWTLEFSLGERDAFLTQRVRFANRGARPGAWMSWSNAGIPARPDTRFQYPGGRVLRHGSKVEHIRWEGEGPRTQGEIKRMAGFFWQDPGRGVFGAFTPSLGCGLYHAADPSKVPGMKLWSDGVGEDRVWVEQYQLRGDPQCLEIQAGPLADQSIKGTLAPGAEHSHAEYWYPSGRPLDIAALPIPSPQLPPVSSIPLFGWALERGSVWLKLLKAHASGKRASPPPPPGATSNSWPPSGMDALGPALAWAAKDPAWRFFHGAWHAGRGDAKAALAALKGSGDERGLALAGRLLRVAAGNPRASAASFRAMRGPLRRHPQVVAEFDRSLAALGRKALPERAALLAETAALQDEELIERRADLLLARGKAAEAAKLLASTPFQLVHQRYARRRLWARICRALGRRQAVPPNWLGEDGLGSFGAYREFEDKDA